MQRVVGRRRLTLSEAESPLINVSFNPPVTVSIFFVVANNYVATNRFLLSPHLVQLMK